MKKTKRTASLIILLSLFTALAASGQMWTRATEEADSLNLQLLITINRMELSHDQMEALHGILTGILEKADNFETNREAFAQEMLAFTGTSEELDQRLETYREAMEGRSSSLQETVEGALAEIQGLLTMEQGKILERGFRGFGLLFGTQDSRLAPLGMRMEGRQPRLLVGPLMRQFRDNGATALKEQLQQLKERVQERLNDRLGIEEQERGQHPFATRLLVMRARPFGRPVSLLEDLVEILEAKLASLT